MDSRSFLCDPPMVPVSDDVGVEIEVFQRFLKEVGYVTWADIWNDNIGWLLYVLGEGPHPPPGFGNVPLTAWTLPG